MNAPDTPAPRCPSCGGVTEAAAVAVEIGGKIEHHFTYSCGKCNIAQIVKPSPARVPCPACEGNSKPQTITASTRDRGNMPDEVVHIQQPIYELGQQVEFWDEDGQKHFGSVQSIAFSDFKEEADYPCLWIFLDLSNPREILHPNYIYYMITDGKSRDPLGHKNWWGCRLVDGKLRETV